MKMVTCRNSHTGKTVQVPAEKLRFRPSVYGIIVHEGNILLSQFKDGWLWPGGAIDPGETVEEALRRELAEETGLTVTQDTFVDFAEDFVESFNQESYIHALRWYFLCKDPKGEISNAGFTEFEKKEMQTPQWVSIDTALTLKIHHPADPQRLIRKAASMLV